MNIYSNSKLFAYIFLPNGIDRWTENWQSHDTVPALYQTHFLNTMNNQKNNAMLYCNIKVWFENNTFIQTTYFLKDDLSFKWNPTLFRVVLREPLHMFLSDNLSFKEISLFIDNLFFWSWFIFEEMTYLLPSSSELPSCVGIERTVPTSRQHRVNSWTFILIREAVKQKKVRR